ncbi:hypothetical protein Gorai_009563, partial [Gossypium raimondii]|nr:hypothetical protein [Gossypium raimondii]
LSDFLYKWRILEETEGTIATETSQSEVEILTVTNENSVGDLVAYGPWMVINRKSRWSSMPNCSQQVFVLGFERMTLDLGLYLSALIVAISGG